MKIHCFQHAQFEDLGCIKNWIDTNGHAINYTQFYNNDELPNTNDYDFLIIMGGPMSVNEEDKYSWLKAEKQAIKDAIDTNKIVLGICLGSQLIANVLGAKIYSNTDKEIGWFDISLTKNPESNTIFNINTNDVKVFHWHGETFNLPERAIHVAYSECSKNQAFLYNNKVLGLQFHLEVNNKSIDAMIENCGAELTNGKYIQSENEIRNGIEYIETNNTIMYSILDNLTKI